jgi:hypothetical protein
MRAWQIIARFPFVRLFNPEQIGATFYRRVAHALLQKP